MRKLVLSLFALLGIALGAHDQPDSWHYVGDNFSATEHIVYVGLVDGDGRAVSLNTGSDWIGAFIDGECRGAVAAASAQQLYYFPLRVKGTEADNGKAITFRYYQAFGNNPLEYSLAPASELVYGNEQSTGTLSALFKLQFIQPLYFTFPETIEVRVGKTLNLMDQFAWEPAKGYKVRIKDGESVDAFNMKADYSADAYEMQLGDKWNWVGFKYQFDHAIADAFNANSGFANGDRIVSKEAGFAEYDGEAWTGTLTILMAGEGY